MKREYGTEQPYFPLGIFKVRLPFVHYKWEISEAFQAILMCATCLGAIPILTETLGVSFEVAWSMVIINGILYNLHALLGDPVVPGWITPSIPLTIAYLSNYQIGVERIHALIAAQILVGVIFLIMGLTGLAGKLMRLVPNSLKSGILLGAGFAAVMGEFKAGGRFNFFPISIAIGGGLAYYLLFSKSFKELRKKNKFADSFGKYGMLPAIFLSIIIGPLVKELPFPRLEIGTFVKIPLMSEINQTLNPLIIGMPTLNLFINAIPIAIMIYIIAFGDFITSGALLDEADKIREDEKIDFNSNRSNLISGIRNIIQAFIVPYVPMCGPLWAAVTASVAERYKEGRKAMDSIYGGVGTFRIVTFLSVAIIPIVSLVQPILPVALSLTMLVQGYVCTRLAMSMCENDIDRGTAGVMAAVLATKGAAWGLAVGIVLQLILVGIPKVSKAVTDEKLVVSNKKG